MSSGAVRLARLGVFCCVALGLATGAHLGAGGAAPGSVALALGTVLVVLAALALTARRRGGVTIGATLLAVQAGLHTLFALLPDPGAAAATATDGHAHHLTPGSLVPAVGPPTGGADSDLAMLVTHLLAALATAAVLARGEAWLHGSLALLLPLVVVLARPLVRPTRTVRRRTPDVPALLGRAVLTSVGLRGPPRMSFA